MAKLKDAPIGQADINEYLEAYSDFTFEIKVLNSLTRLRYQCRHSGVYIDPVTGKMREFDIRAVKTRNVRKYCSFNAFLAVECKNLRENFPLVVHCLPRSKEEAFEELLFFYEDEQQTERNRFLNLPRGEDPHAYNAFTVRQHRTLSEYGRALPVGKSCDQIGRHIQTAEIIGSDSDVFDKVSQALSSSYDLVQEASRYQAAPFNISIIRPVLVVPDDTLWQILYDNDGNVVQGPEKVARLSYFYGKSWRYNDGKGSRDYEVSHLDIVTVSAVDDYVASLFNFEDEDLLDHILSLPEVIALDEVVDLRRIKDR